MSNVIPIFAGKKSIKEIEEGIKRLDSLIHQNLISYEDIGHFLSYAELTMKFIFLASKLKDKKLAKEALELFNQCINNSFITQE